MIAAIELEPFDIIGVPVEAHWDDLPRAVPAAWGELFRSLPETLRFVEVSLDRRDAVYREIVGYVAEAGDVVPPGMIRYRVEGGAFLHAVHEGELHQIAERFAAIYAHAEVCGIKATDFKLDFGYTPGLPAGRHELYVRLG